jgi:hypothetical protein
VINATNFSYPLRAPDDPDVAAVAEAVSRRRESAIASLPSHHSWMENRVHFSYASKQEMDRGSLKARMIASTFSLRNARSEGSESKA